MMGHTYIGIHTDEWLRYVFAGRLLAWGPKQQQMDTLSG